MCIKRSRITACRYLSCPIKMGEIVVQIDSSVARNTAMNCVSMLVCAALGVAKGIVYTA
jgi:hypothetical protein